MRKLSSTLLCLVVIGVVSAEESSPSALEKDPKGWIALIEGKDLKDWKRVPIYPDKKLAEKNPWHLKGTTLHCDGVGVKEMLLYKKPVADGIFHVEWRFRKVEGKKDYNSGIYVRSADDGKIWYQIQVAHLEKPPLLGDIFGDVQVGDRIERVVKRGTGDQRARPVGEWNTFEITTRGNTISVWVNGATTCIFEQCTNKSGHIGLQAEFFELEFRNLKFKPFSK